LLAAGHALSGAQLLISSDVPRGAGLSSSAALTVATGYAFQVLNRLNLLGEELALLAQGAENSFVGVQCGIMDQFISATGRAGEALLLDCRSLQPTWLPLSDPVVVLPASGIPTGMIGQLTRLISSDTPGFSGSTVPSWVRSPSGNISTGTPRSIQASHSVIILAMLSLSPRTSGT